MSSPRKQQKKSKRASVKARQNRILRNNPPDAPALKNPDALSPDMVSMEEFFEGGMEMGAFDDMFTDMERAEEKGLEAVCMVFLAESPLPMVMDNYSGQDVEDLIISLWVAYYERRGLSEDEAIAQIESDAFAEAYVAATAALVELNLENPTLGS